MSSRLLACGLVLMMTATVSFAESQPVKQTTAAPAATAKAKKYTTTTTTMGTLLKDPAAKAVLEKYLPDLMKSDHLEEMTGMTLKDVQQAVGVYAPDLLSQPKLAQIDEELAKLPVKK